MTDESKSNRRDFLRGKSALDAARGNLDKADLEGPSNKEFARSTERESNYVEQYSKNAMACEFELLFNLHQYQRSGSAAMRAFQLIDDLEDQMTVYRDHSEVSQINKTAYSEAVKVEPRLFDLIRLAKAISVDTKNAFDITSGPLSKIWGFDKRAGELPAQELIDQALGLVGIENIHLDATLKSIRIKQSDVTINLNGIGKGHSLDRVKELFEQQRITDFVIHGGQSSVLASGTSNPNEPNNSESSAPTGGWAVGLSHPTLPGVRLGEYVLKNKALGTSGTARQGFFHQGKRYGHIIDPRTGWPASHHLSTTVICDSGALADALATAFFVMPIDEIQSYCESNPKITAIVCESNPKRKGQIELVTFNVDQANWNLLV